MLEHGAENYPNIIYLLEWIKKREAARIHGKSGDPNIDSYRYCNVRRHDDRVTQYIYHWTLPYADHDLIIANTLMARLFNNPPTLENIGYQETWNPRHVMARANEMVENGERVFNPAYIVSTNGRKMDKVEYVVKEVLNEAFSHSSTLGSPELDTMWRQLMKLNGVGSFMAAQVVADLKWLPRWNKAPDWHTFVAPGPGSQRGMNRLRGLDANAQRYSDKAFSMYIQPLRPIIKQGTGLELCAQDVQNCLCEFDKYMRLISGEGKPKQTYKRRTV